MKTIAPWQLKRLHKLLNETGQIANKKDLVKHYSKERTESSRELGFWETVELIKHLESYQKSKSSPTPEKLRDQSADLMRKKIISMLREVGFETSSGLSGKKIADMTRIYDFILSVGYLKKHFNKYSQEELVKLVTQLESIYKKEVSKSPR